MAFVSSKADRLRSASCHARRRHYACEWQAIRLRLSRKASRFGIVVANSPMHSPTTDQSKMGRLRVAQTNVCATIYRQAQPPCMTGRGILRSRSHAGHRGTDLMAQRWGRIIRSEVTALRKLGRNDEAQKLEQRVAGLQGMASTQ
jgi:hypothetical protein